MEVLSGLVVGVDLAQMIDLLLWRRIDLASTLTRPEDIGYNNASTKYYVSLYSSDSIASNLFQYVRSAPNTAIDHAGLCEDNLPSFNAYPTSMGRLRSTPLANGCGAKGKTKFPAGGPGGIWTFTPACDNHDVCYGTCGNSKSSCDRAFLRDMRSACRSFYGTFTWYEKLNPIALLLRRACFHQANAYRNALKTFLAQGPYNRAQQAACR